MSLNGHTGDGISDFLSTITLLGKALVNSGFKTQRERWLLVIGTNVWKLSQIEHMCPTLYKQKGFSIAFKKLNTYFFDLFSPICLSQVLFPVDAAIHHKTQINFCF